MPVQMVKQFLELEQKHFAEDQKIIDHKVAKNNLEAYCYEMRQGLDSIGNLKEFSDPATTAGILVKVNDMIEWIYNDGQVAPKSTLDNNLIELRKIGDPIKERAKFFNDGPPYISQFQEFSEQVNQKLG